MREKASRQAMRRMNKQEFAYNKDLLKEINAKRKTSHYEGSSRVGDVEADKEWKGMVLPEIWTWIQILKS